jgi:hypothetical protein
MTRLVLAALNPVWPGKHHGLLLFGQAAALASLAALAAGVLVPHWLPTVVAFRDARRGIARLDALWFDLSAAFPAVVLPTRPARTVRQAQLRHDRRMLEVAEGLALAHLGAEASDLAEAQGNAERAATVLARSKPSWLSDAGPRATSLLPVVCHAHAERRFLLELAVAYSAVVVPTRRFRGVSA